MVPLAHIPLHGAAGNGSTALHYAVECNAPEIVHDLLFFWGADLNAVNKAGKRPIDYCCSHDDPARNKKGALTARDVIQSAQKLVGGQLAAPL